VGIPAGKIQMIPNGIDMAPYAGAKPADLTSFGVPLGSKTIVCVARLTEQKGVDRLVRAAPQILRQLPDHHLLLVGDGPHRPQLRDLALQLGVADHLHFAGWQPEIPSILRACSLFVLPSRWEGMPNALLEAMACGLPVVSTRTDGVQQVLGPLLDPQTVPEGTPQAIADKVVMVSKDNDLSQHLGRQNQRRVGDEFSLEEMVAQYQRLFEALAATAQDE
jgi:glycosyltransferase involved in cell wall biosynthesis